MSRIYSVGMDKVLRIERMNDKNVESAVNETVTNTVATESKSVNIQEEVREENKGEQNTLPQVENIAAPEGQMCVAMKQLMKEVDKTNQTKQQKITELSNKLADYYQVVANTRKGEEATKKLAEFKECVDVYNTYFMQQFGKSSTYADALYSDLKQKKK